MKAAILERINAPLVLKDLEIPGLKCGQVLVDIHYSGICGRQIGEITGTKGHDPYLPHLLGHEGGGIVTDIGPGVRHVKKGDHVVLHWRKGQGIEAEPVKYGEYGAGPVHTFCDHAVVPENRLTVIEKDIPLDIAALMGCSVTTGLGIVTNEAKIKIGQSVAIAGCGGAGLNVIQGAAMVSAYPIIAIDINDNKLNEAKKYGATHCINNNKWFTKQDIYEITCARGVNVFIDCVGSVDIVDVGFDCLSPCGKLIMVGQPRFDKHLKLHNISSNFQGKTIMDSQGGLTNPTIDIFRYLRLYKAGLLKLDQMITHRFPLDKVNEAVEVVKSGKAVKCVLEMDH